MTQPAHGWRSHYALLMLLFVYTMSFIDRQIMGILVQPIKLEFGVSDTAMGLLTGLAFALFYSVLAVPFGRYADRANRRNFVAYCCAAWSVMTALMLRFTVIEPRRGQWDVPGSVPVGAAAEPMRVLLRDLWASRAFVRITLACLLMGVTGYGIGIWTPAFLVRSHGMSLQGAGIVMGLMGGVFAMLGALTSGWLSDKLGKRDARWRIGVPMLGCLLAMPSGLAFFMMPAGGAWQVGGMLVPHALGFYVVFAFTAVWWTAPVYAVLAELVPAHRRSSGMAIFNLGITMLGGGLGPLLVGMLSDFLVPHFGDEALRWALAATTGICFLLGMLVFAWTIRPYAVERRLPAAARAPAVPGAMARA